MYIIKDTRHERKEGKPSYFYEGTAVTFDPKLARQYATKKQAEQAARSLRHALDYLKDSGWITVQKILAQ